MKNALLIDGNSLVFRAYYGSINQLDYYVKNNKTPANAIKLTMLQLFKILSDFNYDYALIAFDHKDKNFRKEIFEDYKSNRKPIPSYLIEQIEIIKKITPLFGIKTMCVSGIEADDLIGSAVKLFSNNNINSFVFSSDKDMLQLVSEKCKVIQFKKGLEITTNYNLQNFAELFFGLKPNQVIDFKAISGDSSDNIPGIKGLGPKTTIDLLKRFDDIENIYKNIDDIENERIKSKFIDNKEKLFFYKKLVKILDDKFEDKDVNEFILKELKVEHIKSIIDKFKFSGFSKYI